MNYFTSDQHFGHENVIRYCSRPFKNAQEMDEALIKNWNDLVTPEDTVYVLGDLSMSLNSAVRVSPRLVGKKYLIPGNHDQCHSYHKKSRSEEKQLAQIKRYEDLGWIILPEQTSILLYGTKFTACHMPYQMDTAHEGIGDDKYTRYRPVDDGVVLLCGHIHEKWKSKRSPKGTLMVNVGVDVWDYKPVAQNRLADFIRLQKP